MSVVLRKELSTEGISYLHIENSCLFLFVSHNHNAGSNLTDAEIDPSLYTIRRQLNDKLVLHARIVGVSFLFQLQQ